MRGLRELSAANASAFRSIVGAALAPDLHCIEVDLSQAGLVDSGGLGALLSLYRAANGMNRNGGVSVSLVNPQPSVRQMFELTRMDRLFEIVSAPERIETGRKPETTS